MYVVLIRPHTLDIPVIHLAGFINIMFNVLAETSRKNCFPVLRDKYEMHHQKVFVMLSMLIFIH